MIPSCWPPLTDVLEPKLVSAGSYLFVRWICHRLPPSGFEFLAHRGCRIANLFDQLAKLLFLILSSRAQYLASWGSCALILMRRGVFLFVRLFTRHLREGRSLTLGALGGLRRGRAGHYRVPERTILQARWSSCALVLPRNSHASDEGLATGHSNRRSRGITRSGSASIT